MANEQPLTLTFACGRCNARLTVKSLLAGKKINCPKCHKKILVPKENDGVAVVPDDLSVVAPDGDGAKPVVPKASATRKAPVADKPAPPKPAGKPVDAPADKTTETTSDQGPEKPSDPPAETPVEKPVTSPPAPPSAKAADLAAAEAALKEKTALLDERRRELDALRNQLSEQQRRDAERNAEMETLRRQETASREQLEARETQQHEQLGQVAAQHEQALQAAQRKVAELERRLAQQQAQRTASGSAASPAPALASPVTAASPDDDGPDPDDLIADLQQSTLRRGLRLSLAAHAVLLLVTSIGFIYWMIRGRPEPEPEAETAVEAPRAPGAAEREEAAMDLNTPPERRDTAPAQPVEPARPRSSIEEAVESLPEPGETPEPSDISLDLDI